MSFKNLDERVIDFLETLVWPNINVSTLTYPDDYKKLIKGFRKLLLDEISYNIDEIWNWLLFHRQENRLSEHAIERIVDLAEYTRIDLDNYYECFNENI